MTDDRPTSADPIPDASGVRPRRRTIAIAAAAAALAIGAVVALAVLSPRGDGRPSAGSGGSASASASTSPTADPAPSTAAPSPTEPPPPTSVPLDTPAEIGGTGLTARIGSLEAVDGQAEGPGQVAGPAIRFGVTLVNGSDAEVPIEGTVVTVDYGPDRTPALELDQPGGVPFPASLAPGDSVTGVFVFTVPAEQRAMTKITVDYAVGVSPLVFEGATPLP